MPVHHRPEQLLVGLGSPVSGLFEQHEIMAAPESRTREQAVATLQSPQFRRTLDVFSAALVSGRLDLRHFGLDPQVEFTISSRFSLWQGAELAGCTQSAHVAELAGACDAACMTSRAGPWNQQT